MLFGSCLGGGFQGVQESKGIKQIVLNPRQVGFGRAAAVAVTAGWLPRHDSLVANGEDLDLARSSSKVFRHTSAVNMHRG